MGFSLSRGIFPQFLALPALFTSRLHPILIRQCWQHRSLSSLPTMSAAGGTYRGTSNRGQGRGQVPIFDNTPGGPSNIPRPKFESHASSAMQSESGTSTLSASRQKQSKRDEVSYTVSLGTSIRLTTNCRLSGRRWRPTSAGRKGALLLELDIRARPHQAQSLPSSLAKHSRSNQTLV